MMLVVYFNLFRICSGPMVIPVNFRVFIKLFFGATSLMSSHRYVKCKCFSEGSESPLAEDSTIREKKVFHDFELFVGGIYGEIGP